MPNYRSLVPGGYFSSTPMDKSTGPVTKRCNNPGAINGAGWEVRYPGYVDTVETTPGNKSTIFEAPEFGVGAWWELLRRYQASNASTVSQIVTKYGGGQDYSAYLQFVLKQTGFSADTVIDLNNDQQVLKLGHAMFRYECGQSIPWSDDQILCGIRGGRSYASTGVWPALTGPPVPIQPPPGPDQISDSDLKALLQKLLVALAAGTATTPTTKVTPVANPVNRVPAVPILSTIDKLIGGQALVGYKTMFGVIGYVIVAILQATGVLGVATPAGQILTVLTLAFSALGGLSKLDRMTQSLAALAANAK